MGKHQTVANDGPNAEVRISSRPQRQIAQETPDDRPRSAVLQSRANRNRIPHAAAPASSPSKLRPGPDVRDRSDIRTPDSSERHQNAARRDIRYIGCNPLESNIFERFSRKSQPLDLKSAKVYPIHDLWPI